MFTTTMFNTTSVLQNINNLIDYNQYIDQMYQSIMPYIGYFFLFFMKLMFGYKLLDWIFYFIYEFTMLIPKIAYWISKQLYNIILSLVNVYNHQTKSNKEIHSNIEFGEVRKPVVSEQVSEVIKPVREPVAFVDHHLFNNNCYCCLLQVIKCNCLYCSERKRKNEIIKNYQQQHKVDKK